MINAVDKTNRRLLFALALPKSLQQKIVQWRADHLPADAGRPIAAANLHLTLAFLGEVSAAKAQVLQQQAGRISQSGFNVMLDDIGHWPSSGVVWLGCKTPPSRAITVSAIAALTGRAQWLLSNAAAFSSPCDPTAQSHYLPKPKMNASTWIISHCMNPFSHVVVLVITSFKTGRWRTVPRISDAH